ncbi:M3 family oligoendopeptidase [Pseudosulfitobacter pseudonitzschiae]|uniref:M3 family oligoendopeptidase n=1 Tax=Pseudosulfitobacter pseudonitzschiae TaxID=1402135 RepID=UPI001AF5FAC4|nr:M3 family oligoendopeptidase [Pseudosulfitobacter pseudonitzschiae]MBM1815355.1 M3 family oligoendopeptidase [Pseudosulfitobacter pseudonitzschiae]MBM1832346.1 M3 family oligoendopeptidase [Pseudosulfitobacter pseudonitzschiae]MBM1837214.1 M3 family oligoendopeptidase [Pseudosulfitobacter pseudonitzschiae]MBM1842060.1 M3 family oligoendopeptidase [Pseudosulfitobacter pseudonitzschiae]MBM1846928.1 M3 family oligoendopeptidase [Pseudosulfitobacter pseudonitzschiae]
MFQLPFPVQDANAAGGGKHLGDLPEWNLDDLYTGEDAPELKRDLDWLEEACASFAHDFENNLAGLDAEGLLDCILRQEKINQVAGRIMSYAGLRYYQQTTDGGRAKFMSDVQEKITNFTTPLVFFTLELNRLDDDHLSKLMHQNADLARYEPVFDRIRAMKPYQLSDEMEKFLHDLGVVGDAWERLFDETIAGLEFNVQGDDLTIEGTLNLLTDPDRDTRQAAAEELADVFGKNIKTFARVHNTQTKEKEIMDRWREMPTAQTARHLSNHVEPEVVEALRTAVVNAYPKLSHRYYELKRKWLGLDRMQVWDRNAPLPLEDPKLVPWDVAEKTVMDAYNAFDPRMGEIAAPFFTKGWIDAPVKPGKAPGAFAHPTVTDVHPYVMLNYLGKPRDVMTLAHELGHGVHQVLAAGQGEMLSSTPLTLAETASVFGEMLTFRKMLDGAKTNAQRKVLLAGKVEDMINTVVRQIAFYDFECKLHAARRGGELTPEDIGELWMSVQGESLGPAFDFMDGYEHFWAYIPHFVHSPFYVYAYAFGDGLVNALYSVYAEGVEGFEDKYFDMLRAGGSKHHKELLAPFGLDASDPAFWDKGLSMISGFIDELEAMED